MSASVRLFTVRTVSGSFRMTFAFDPSRVLTVRVCPVSATMVPRMRVGGAVWATAVTVSQQTASPSDNRRIDITLTPHPFLRRPDHGNEADFGKGAGKSKTATVDREATSPVGGNHTTCPILAPQEDLPMARQKPEVVISHNPSCSTSRKVLGMIREAGIEPRIIEYLKTPPNRQELVDLLHRMGLSPRQILRRRGTPYDELGLGDPGKTDES